RRGRAARLLDVDGAVRARAAGDLVAGDQRVARIDGDAVLNDVLDQVVENVADEQRRVAEIVGAQLDGVVGAGGGDVVNPVAPDRDVGGVVDVDLAVRRAC